MHKLLVVSWLAGCSSLDAPPPGEPLPTPPTPDAPVAPAPSIADALDCGDPGTTGVEPGTDLQRVTIDLATYPEATCNDGTPATFYIRPSATLAGRTRWVIQLQGGGGCFDADSCAQRWCSVNTFMGVKNMSTRADPEVGMTAGGILSRDPRNPYADANHVYVRYCSSDTHSGVSGPLDVDGHHPLTGEPVRYRISFQGRAVFDTVIAMLRRERGEALPFTLQGASDELPDLDTATDVLLAGASAGAGGVIANADRLSDALPDRVTALIDSTLGPAGETLDWTTSTPCLAAGDCTWPQQLERGSSLFARHTDASCEAFHTTADAYLCTDGDHLVKHHLTTPFVVRQGLRDQLLLENSVASHVSVPGQGEMTPNLFTSLVRQQLATLPSIQTTAEEAASITVAPGVFGPNCADHETLSQDSSTYGVSVDGLTMFDVLSNWRAGTGVTVAIQQPGSTPDCQ